MMTDVSFEDQQQQLVHAVLEEIGLANAQQNQQQRSSSSSLSSSRSNQRHNWRNKHPPSSRNEALDILNYLLQTNQLQADVVREAHKSLHKSSVKSSVAETTAPSAQEEKTNQTTTEGDPVSPPPPPPALANNNNFQRHIAFRIYYDGAKYSGLAENVGRDTDCSIEKALFAALLKARLIQSRETCGYSRCGRTDKGVSAAGQVVALRVKSAFRLDATLLGSSSEGTTISRPIQEEDLPNNGYDKLTVCVPPRKGAEAPENDAATKRSKREMTEYSYDKILNSLLPNDIRVLGWCPVSSDFSARFSATSRTYRYFFLARQLDLALMQEALQHLVGTHDFRNFCRMDVEKVYNFKRTIHSAQLIVGEDGVCYFEIHGQAFLWHQIRCIAAILFLVGQKLETPDIVTDLFNIAKYPGKPSYQLAPDLPLVLHDCAYHCLPIGHSVPNLWNVMCGQDQLWEDALLAAARIKNCLDKLECAPVLVEDLVSFVADKLKTRKRKKNQVPQQRLTNPSVAVANDDVDLLQAPFDSRKFVTWKEALDWMKGLDLVLGPSGARKEAIYVPLLQRFKGPTYEEKVASLQQSSKRKQRFEDNVIKKRQSKEEDSAFYEHMVKQGGSSAYTDGNK